MQEYGTVLAQLVTSNAKIPLPGAVLAITQTLPDGTQALQAVRLANYDGFTAPVTVPTPPASDSQTRQTELRPYSVVTLCGTIDGYDRVKVQGVQVFANTQTLQQLFLIPTPTLPGSYSHTQVFDIPPQALQEARLCQH